MNLLFHFLDQKTMIPVQLSNSDLYPAPESDPVIFELYSPFLGKIESSDSQSNWFIKLARTFQY